jgi:hypothetical protein
MQEDYDFKASPGKSNGETLSQKQNKTQRARGIAQVMESLPRMHKALSLLPSIEEEEGGGGR